MAGLSTGLKQLLTIADEGASTKFEVMINPANYSVAKTNCFNENKANGQTAPQLKYSGTKGDVLSFDFVLDGTGVVKLIGLKSVKSQIETLKKVVNYDGKEHDLKTNKVVWGSLKFEGYMTSMNIDYTLFKPTGDPLRAKVKLSFTEKITVEEANALANRSSPDLTHMIEVKAGDTLPQLCHRVYGTSDYYINVARLNNLDNFRELSAGTKLVFPPLK